MIWYVWLENIFLFSAAGQELLSFPNPVKSQMENLTNEECTIAHQYIEYGQDYNFWTSEYTFSKCKAECESNPKCDGITWVKNSNR